MSDNETPGTYSNLIAGEQKMAKGKIIGSDGDNRLAAIPAPDTDGMVLQSSAEEPTGVAWASGEWLTREQADELYAAVSVLDAYLKTADADRTFTTKLELAEYVTLAQEMFARHAEVRQLRDYSDETFAGKNDLNELRDYAEEQFASKESVRAELSRYLLRQDAADLYATQANLDDLATRLDTAVKSVAALASALDKRLLKPVETPTPDAVLVAGTDLQPHWKATPVPPPPWLWRDLAAADANGKLEYVGWSGAFGSNVDFKLAPNGTIRIRRNDMTGMVEVKFNGVLYAGGDQPADGWNYVVNKLVAGWIPAGKNVGEIGVTVAGKASTVEWRVQPGQFDPGIGLSRCRKGMVLDNGAVFKWQTFDPAPATLPRESKDQT